MSTPPPSSPVMTWTAHRPVSSSQVRYGSPGVYIPACNRSAHRRRRRPQTLRYVLPPAYPPPHPPCPSTHPPTSSDNALTDNRTDAIRGHDRHARPPSPTRHRLRQHVVRTARGDARSTGGYDRPRDNGNAPFSLPVFRRYVDREM